MIKKWIRTLSIPLLVIFSTTLIYIIGTVISGEIQNSKSTLYYTQQNLTITQNTLEATRKDYQTLKDSYDKLTQDFNQHLEKERSTLAKKTISRGSVSKEFVVTPSLLQTITPHSMRATTYDLSVESCGKLPKHPSYGITRTGERVIYKTTVAVDPKYIPLGSILYIAFPEKYKSMTGIYKAMDTGSAVKNNIIDIYVGERKKAFCSEFGSQSVTVYIIGKF
jgi:3D (Asp-Asp-Asp) domain-containing protein